MMEELVEILARIWGEGTKKWAHTPNQFIDNQTPVEFCQSHGYDKVKEVLNKSRETTIRR